MASSVPKFVLVLSIFLFGLLPLSLSTTTQQPLTYHGGPLLSGNLNLGVLWYGRFGRVQKNTIRKFIKSINFNNGNSQPQVSTWWAMVESYSTITDKKTVNPKIVVTAKSQVTDPNYSVGKVLTEDFIQALVPKATRGDHNTIAVILTARDVTVAGSCLGKCSQHGVFGKNLYIVVGNPETECPGACAWPFHKSDHGPQGVTLQPPSGSVGADAMVVELASALAEIAANPYNTGFFAGDGLKEVEVASACQGMFGSGSSPGKTGKVRIDPRNGGAFNAKGYKGSKFLLPAIWNPKSSSCWTVM